MQKNKLKGWMRLLMALSAVAVMCVLFIPFWRIELDAPQYPEGLVLQIYAGKLGGDVDIINGLNHYIGMKTLHANEFVEFTILPYLTVAFGLMFLITAISGSKKLLRVSFISFVIFGVVAMTDFWRWEYDYGHNLNPEAAIKVPGMAYQPPLIGYKQLLNFGAYSVPDIGGWIFIAAGFIVAVLVVIDLKQSKKIKSVAQIKRAVVAASVLLFISSCNTKPEPLVAGKDNCAFCKMEVTDLRFGGEFITQKGRIYKFDDAHCLLSYVKSGMIDKAEIKDIYLVDFSTPHAMISTKKALLISSESLHSPMSGNIAAFSNKSNMINIKAQLNAEAITWDKLWQ